MPKNNPNPTLQQKEDFRLEILGKRSELISSDSNQIPIERLLQQDTQKCIEYLLGLVKSPQTDVKNASLAILGHFGEQIIDYILGYILSEEKSDRIVAVTILGYLKSNKTLPLLVKMFGVEKEENVRLAIVEIVGNIGGINEVPFLLNCLKEAKVRKSQWEIFHIVFALTKIADESVSGEILDLLNDNTLRTLAIEFLGNTGDPSIVPELFDMLGKEKSDFTKILNILNALKQIENKVVEIQKYQRNRSIFDFMQEMFQKLRNNKIIEIVINKIALQSLPNQKILLWALRRMRKPFPPEPILNLVSETELHTDILNTFLACKKNMTDFFIQQLNKKNIDKQLLAIKYLSNNMSAKSLSAISKAVKQKNKDVKMEVALGLGLSLNTKAIKPLLFLLCDSEPDVVISAIGALALVGGQKVLEKIKQLMLEKSNLNKKDLMIVLCLIKKKFALHEVVHFIDVDDTELKVQAIKIIGALGQTYYREIDKQELLGKLKKLLKSDSVDVQIETIRTLCKVYKENNDVMDTFYKMLEYSSDLIRSVIAKEIVSFRNKHVLSFVLDNLRDDLEPNILIRYIELAGDLSTGEGVDRLLEFINFPEPEVQGKLLNTLGRIRDKSALPSIIEKCYSNNWYIRKSALDALGYFNDKRVEKHLVIILKSLSQENMESKYYDAITKSAIRAFGRSDTCKKIESVLPFFKDERFVRDVYRTLFRKEDVLFKQMETFIDHEDLWVKSFIAMILGEINKAESVKFLIEFLKDDHARVRRSALMSLGKFNSSDALKTLRTFSENKKISELEKYLVTKSLENIKNRSVAK